MTKTATIIPYHNTKRRKAAVTIMLSSVMLAAAGIELFSVTIVTGGEFLEPSVTPVLSSTTNVSQKVH